MHEAQVISPKHNTWQAQGNSFKVSTPANDHLLVTSIDLIRELIEAPRQRLSLHAVAKEVCSVAVVWLGPARLMMYAALTAEIHNAWL